MIVDVCSARGSANLEPLERTPAYLLWGPILVRTDLGLKIGLRPILDADENGPWLVRSDPHADGTGVGPSEVQSKNTRNFAETQLYYP